MHVRLLKNHREFLFDEVAQVTDVRGQAMIDQDIAVAHASDERIKQKAETAQAAQHRETRSKKRKTRKGKRGL